MSNNPSTQTSPRLSGLVYATGPFLWAVLILFHPDPAGDTAYDGVSDVVDRWLVIHVGQLILTPFLFLAVWRLLNGLTSTAATISRCALVVWTVFFSAYDAIVGIATGVLVRHTNDLPDTEQDAIAGTLDYLVYDSLLAGNTSVIGMVAGGAWLTVAIAAAVALHRANAGRTVVVCACLSTVFAMHVAPAAIGLLALTAAVVVRERQRSPQPAGSAEPTPLNAPSTDLADESARLKR
jgi:quinol-cytochrome oxidoreductase complex cytochrome b subunit